MGHCICSRKVALAGGYVLFCFVHYSSIRPRIFHNVTWRGHTFHSCILPSITEWHSHRAINNIRPRALTLILSISTFFCFILRPSMDLSHYIIFRMLSIIIPFHTCSDLHWEQHSRQRTTALSCSFRFPTRILTFSSVFTVVITSLATQGWAMARDSVQQANSESIHTGIRIPGPAPRDVI